MDKLRELLKFELKDMYFAEKKQMAELEKLADETGSKEAKEAFENHMKTTEKQVERLKSAFAKMGLQPSMERCEGIMGILEESRAVSKLNPSKEIKELFNLGGALKVERYEMTAYEGMIRMAEQLGMVDLANLFTENLHEEREAFNMFSEVSDNLRQAVA